MIDNSQYWIKRYLNHQTGWDIGYPSPPLIEYTDQLPDKKIKILIPGCGHGYEAQYLYQKGFENTFVLDFAKPALENLKKNVPDFPKNQLLYDDFFEYQDQFDLVLEQTFFCSLSKSKRDQYAKKMKQLITPGGKLVGVLFNKEFEQEGPPFGGIKEEYTDLFSQYFNIKILNDCYNSIPPRMGNELFFIFENL
ncbi:methyltransferase domain-containing protein [Aquimarina sp. 2201CG5-10]|uniref:methyltransferase domain-containing protein n=1 Tax=Aquimarina callyspongiae TaxID=3098150 RepID=UPI002AB43631|nr:methyltransferase domain-containing protein [Aquimarina sp. 2201CG5-10]MDY8137731.1 methyltransferase domain-containing protein [Aquimarina sp. 2201CG5-10]